LSKEAENQSFAQNDTSLDEGANQEGVADTDVKDRPAASGAQNMAVLVVAALVIIGILYYFFSGSNTKSQSKTDYSIPNTNNAPQTSGNIPVPQLDVSSSLSSGEIVLESQKSKTNDTEKPKEVPKSPVPLPPQNENVSHVAILPPAHENAGVQKQQMQEQQNRMKSNIMLRNGGGDDSSSATSKVRDLNSNFKPTATEALSTKVTKVGNLSYLITQGKIIESVLETPINTNFPGPVRAVVSRDVYSEKGENVLVPKGSRLIGSFSPGIQNGQARVAIQWTRIIMPNGYDINIQQAPAVDNLGQVGINGDIHREFFGIIGNAVLLSIMNVALAKEAQKQYNIQSNQTQTTTNTDGSSTTTSNSDPAQQAAQQQVQQLGSVTQQWFKENFQVKPYVTINQGTVVKVFVNQDILFPSNIFSGVNNLG
jgi:type IV secretion system protein VirB10